MGARVPTQHADAMRTPAVGILRLKTDTLEGGIALGRSVAAVSRISASIVGGASVG